MEFEVEQRRQSRLLSLSTELLLLILENVRTSGLLALSRTSRLLHYLALPTYLSRHGINDPTSRKLVLESQAAHALPGFQISLFITSLDHLSYKFKGVHPHFAREVNQFLRFVTRLSHINEVTLDLGNIDCRWVDGLAIASSNFWKPDFVRLLMVILQKKCVSLTITHGRFLNPDLPFHGPSALASRHTIIGDSVSAIKKLLGPVNSHRSAADYGMALRPTYSNELHKFCIHADVLLTRPFHDWMMGTLNTSPITSLSFRLLGLHPTTWTNILSSVTIPTLSQFSPESPDITFDDLLRFFFRHPSIVDVGLHPHINHLDSGRLPGPRTKKRLLPNLASLSGSPGNIRTLLNYLHPVPQLQSISLSLRVHQRLFQTSDFGKLNSEIGVVMQDTKPLALSLRFSVPFNIDEPFESKPGKNENFLLSFPSVQTLSFSTDGRFDFTRWIIPVLLDWLSKTFPALHHVSFAGNCVPVEADLRAAFVHTISQTYRGIELEIVGENDELSW
jgi:hypothetical protein